MSVKLWLFLGEQNVIQSLFSSCVEELRKQADISKM